MDKTMVFIGGEWVSPDRASVSVFDHGLLYGDGVYEGVRVYDGTPFLLEEHTQRLMRSARAIDLEVPVPKNQIREILTQGLRQSGLSNAYVRILVTRGVGPIGPDPVPCNEPEFIVILKDIPPLHGAGRDGVTTALSSMRRVAVDSTSAEIKSLNYLTSILGKREAHRLGVDDVILLDSRGFVAEAPVCNVFLCENGTLMTPSAASGILRGITRQLVMDIAADQGIALYEGDLTPTQLLCADEIFLTGTHAETVAVLRHNGMVVGDGAPGPIYRSIHGAFKEKVGT